MEHIGITELDPFAPDEQTAPPRPRRVPRVAVVGAFALGAIVGSVAGFSAADRGSSSAVAPASSLTGPAYIGRLVGDRPNDNPNGGIVGSADTIARRAEAERRQRIELCTSSPHSADALERCILGSDFER